MDKNKILIIAAASAIVILVLFMPGVLRKAGMEKSITPKASAGSEIVMPLFKNTKDISGAEAETEGTDDASARDPFALPEVTHVETSNSSDLALTGITTGAKGKLMAVINGKFVYSGGKVGDFTVMSITSSKVVLTNGTETIELKMGK
jgi:hypothetical protein